MNRPTFDELRTTLEDFKILNDKTIEYIVDIAIKEERRHCQKLNNALDKACEILEFNDKSGYCGKPMTKERWKEWLMKDEQFDKGV